MLSSNAVYEAWQAHKDKYRALYPVVYTPHRDGGS
jgi:hypothetical protein